MYSVFHGIPVTIIQVINYRLTLINVIVLQCPLLDCRDIIVIAVVFDLNEVHVCSCEGERDF